MAALYVANALCVIVAGWALWVRRSSFHSRWDAPITAGVALYGLAVALDSPWPGMAAASYPVTGKYYLLPALGHLCYLVGTAAGVKSVFIRLLPDGDIAPFMRTRITPAVTLAGAVMAVCVIASPVTSRIPADHLYGVPLDGWLRVYFITFFATFVALLWTAVFGGYRLREDPHSGAVVPLMWTASIGSLACLAALSGILRGRSEIVATWAWPVSYLATAAASVVCAVFWRRRIADLTRSVEQDSHRDGRPNSMAPPD